MAPGGYFMVPYNRETCRTNISFAGGGPPRRRALLPWGA